MQELLTLFGVPYVIAPQEAEAQCAWMNAEGLVDAVVTDDSDAFLFGAKHVYRNVFESKKYVEAYAADRIEAELGLDRARMAELALLLGSDYTEGVGGVGIVNALEIVNAFPGLDGLAEFRDWVNIAEFTGAVPRALLASEAKPKRKKRRSELASSVRGKETEDEDAEDDASSDDEDATVLASVSRDADENPASARFKEQHRAVKKGWDLPPPSHRNRCSTRTPSRRWTSLVSVWSGGALTSTCSASSALRTSTGIEPRRTNFSCPC